MTVLINILTLTERQVVGYNLLRQAPKNSVFQILIFGQTVEEL